MDKKHRESDGAQSLDAVLSEFQALRSEMLWRIQNRESIQMFVVAAVGTSVSLAIQQRNSHLMLACAYVGAFGGASYLHHCVAITKLGRYIRDVTSPEVHRMASGAFRWESYHRTDQGAVRLRTLQYRARAVSNLIVFGGSISAGLVAPAPVLAQRVLDGGVWAVAWEIVLWLIALVIGMWLLIRLRQWEAAQKAMPLRQEGEEVAIAKC